MDITQAYVKLRSLAEQEYLICSKQKNVQNELKHEVLKEKVATTTSAEKVCGHN